MDKNDVTAGAKRIAASLEGPFGRRKLQPVIAEHLDYFAKARASGALWTPIAHVLARAGVLTGDGKPYGANMLRAMVSRAERAVQSEPALHRPLAAPAPHAAAPNQDRTPTSPPRHRPAKSAPSAPPVSPKLDAVRDRMARAARLRGLDEKEK